MDTANNILKMIYFDNNYNNGEFSICSNFNCSNMSNCTKYCHLFSKNEANKQMNRITKSIISRNVVILSADSTKYIEQSQRPTEKYIILLVINLQWILVGLKVRVRKVRWKDYLRSWQKLVKRRNNQLKTGPKRMATE